MKSLYFLFLIIIFSGHNVFANGNILNDSFKISKQTLISSVYHDHKIDFYCNVVFNEKSQIVNRNGYVPQEINERSSRIEWEHVVPASWFGKLEKAWIEGHPACIENNGKMFKGRKCAELTSSKFRYMQADMYNLYPAVGEVNGLRSDYPYGIIENGTTFGQCDFKIGRKMAEPPKNIRGDIARTFFYMITTYNLENVIDIQDINILTKWHTEDPVDQWECTRTKRIENIQKNENTYVKKYCIKEKMW